MQNNSTKGSKVSQTVVYLVLYPNGVITTMTAEGPNLPNDPLMRWASYDPIAKTIGGCPVFRLS